MASTVGNERDKVFVGTFRTSQQTVNGLDDNLDDVDVLPLIETADVVGLGNHALVEDEVDGTCVVFHKQPVADVFTLAVDGKRLAVADVVDEQGYQLLWELVGTIVVRAVGHDDGHAVGVVVGTDEVVARGLCSTIRRVGIVLRRLQEELVAVSHVVLGTAGRRGERRLNAFGVCQLQGTIHLVSRDMVETLALIALGQRLPIEFGSLQETECSHDVGLGKGEGVLDRAVHMALSGEMDYTINMFILHQFKYALKVANVHLDKLIVWLILNVLEVGQVTCIGELIQINNLIIRILVYVQTYNVATYKACTTSYNNCPLHIYWAFKLTIHFLSESVQYGTLTSKVSFTLVLSRTLYAGRLTGLGNSSL